MTNGIDGFSEDGEYPLAAGTVKGYRDWYITLIAPGSVMYDFGASMPSDKWEADAIIGAYGGVWENAGWREAQCGNPSWARSHDVTMPVPGDGCGCGFWAYWNPVAPNRIQVDTPSAVFLSPGYTAMPYPEESPSWARITLTGLAEGAGRTIIGTRGFRCQKMRVLAIAPYMDPASWLQLEKLLKIPASECVSLVMNCIASVMKGAIIEGSYEDLPRLAPEETGAPRVG